MVRLIALTLLLAAGAASTAVGEDWIVAPGPFTHHPQTGVRTPQFAQPPRIVLPPDRVSRSIYRYSRSSLQVGDSIDNLHVVEESGRPVAPYREWQYPYQPWSAPYGAWGPQFPGGFGFGGFGGAVGPRPGFVRPYGNPFHPADPRRSGVYGPYEQQEWYDRESHGQRRPNIWRQTP